MKKIFFILMLLFVAFSCGKKGDPEYKESKKFKVQSILKNKV